MSNPKETLLQMTGPGGAGSSFSQACAACKHQRRKCAPDCVLAPYFPPHRQTEFLNVHRLFGVRNVLNTVKNVEPDHRDDAVRSMIHEAYFRAIDPAGGAYRILNDLEQRYIQMKEELDLVHQHIACFRSTQIEFDTDQTQNFDHPFPQQSTQLGNQTSIGTIKKEESSQNHHKQALQLVPYERNGHTKIDNIDENNSLYHDEREEADLNSPEDVKPNVQG